MYILEAFFLAAASAPSSAAELNGVRLKKDYYEKLSDYILTHVSE